MKETQIQRQDQRVGGEKKQKREKEIDSQDSQSNREVGAIKGQ